MNRPRQHKLETISKKALEQIIPDEWVVRPLTPDYGIDYMVEIFKHGKASGNFFYIQLKGTDQVVNKQRITISIKRSTLEYFATLPLPILFVAYATKDKKFRGTWVNELLRVIKPEPKQKTVSLTLSEQHLIDRGFVKNIEKVVNLDSIKKINIEMTAQDELSEKYHLKIKEFINHYCPNLFVFRKALFPVCMTFKYGYHNNKLSLEIDYNLLGEYKLNKIKIRKDSDLLVYHSTYKVIPAELQEAMFLIAIFISRVNIISSIKILEKILPFYNGKYSTPTTIADIGKIALESNSLVELQQLIEVLIQHKKWNEFQFLMLMMFSKVGTLSQKRLEFYKQNLINVINSDADDEFKGTLSYNLANSYSANSDKLYLSAKYYFQARRLNHDYLNRSYWWDEVAGILFRTGHFKYSEKFYIKADSMSDRFRPKIYALIGDALLFQGNFPEARKWFKKYIKSKEGKDSEFHLKLISLQHFKKRFGEIRKRNIKETEKTILNFLLSKSMQLSKNDYETILKENIFSIPKIEKIMKLDPLCGFAWVIYGNLLVKSKKIEEAFYAFLFCALTENWFPIDAWINSLFLSLHLREYILFAQILDVISFKFDDSILEHIADALKQNPYIPQNKKETIFKEIKSMLLTISKKGIWEISIKKQ